MRIQEVESATGMDRATIRFYEREGLLEPERLDNSYRNYTDDHIQLLLKIKLLRQLGVSLPEIKELQQGSANCATVLSKQIDFLTQRMQQDDRAISVCRQMHKDSVHFSSLDSNRYLEMLSNTDSDITPQYKEQVETETHPVRRYCARVFDYLLIIVIIDFVFISIFRIRPFTNILLSLIQYLAYFIAVPLEALFLSTLGTTPGKWLMGIRIEGVNGGKLDFMTALNRSYGVLKDGCGFYIPGWSIYRLYKSYNAASVGIESLWDEESEVVYTGWKVFKIPTFAVLTIMIILGNIWIMTDTVFPGNRTEYLSISDFIENYEDYEKMFGYDSNYYFDEQGRWVEKSSEYEVIIIGYEDHKPRKNFEYEFKDGYLKAIHFSDEWNNVNFIDILPAYCLTSTYAIVGSRKNVTYNDVKQLENIIQSELYDKIKSECGAGFDNDSYEGSIQIDDVRLSWKIILDGNIVLAQDILITPDSDDTENCYKLEYHIEIV